MNEPTKNVSVEALGHYSESDAAMLGALLAELSSQFSGEPVEESTIRNIIESPSHDVLVARLQDGTIVGTATLSIIRGIGAGTNAYLEDFIVSEHHRGQGISDQLWQAVLDWCSIHQLGKLAFTSRPERAAAHRFYLKHGATVRDTSAFVKIIEK